MSVGVIKSRRTLVSGTSRHYLSLTTAPTSPAPHRPPLPQLAMSRMRGFVESVDLQQLLAQRAEDWQMVEAGERPGRRGGWGMIFCSEGTWEVSIEGQAGGGGGRVQAQQRQAAPSCGGACMLRERSGSSSVPCCLCQGRVHADPVACMQRRMLTDLFCPPPSALSPGFPEQRRLAEEEQQAEAEAFQRAKRREREAATQAEAEASGALQLEEQQQQAGAAADLDALLAGQGWEEQQPSWEGGSSDAAEPAAVTPQAAAAEEEEGSPSGSESDGEGAAAEGKKGKGGAKKTRRGRPKKGAAGEEGA